MVIHIKTLQSRGFTPTRDAVRVIAFKFAESLIRTKNFNEEKQKTGYDRLEIFGSKPRVIR